MYQLHSLQRPGRSQWTLTACAVLLVITLILALGLTVLKKHLYYVPLAQDMFIPEARIKVRLPADWIPITVNDIPGAVVGLAESDNKKSDSRLLFVFHNPVEKVVYPSRQVEFTIRHIIQTLEPGVIYKSVLIPHKAIGPFLDWTLRLIPQLKPASYEGTPYKALGRAMVNDAGHLVGLLLMLPKEPGPADLKLLDKISEQVVLLDDDD